MADIKEEVRPCQQRQFKIHISALMHPSFKREVHLNPFVKKRCKCTCTRVYRYGGAEFEKLHCITYITGIENTFLLSYTKKFQCTLYGARFSLGELQVIAGPLHLDLEDLRNKINTFQPEDCRMAIFEAVSDYVVYVMRATADKAQINEVRTALTKKYKGELHPFSANKLQLNWGFISEIPER